MPTYPTYKLGDILSYEQPTNYIVESTEYDDSYPIPVLTAGKSFILGYTNETNGVYDKLPVIIFDDFTTASKYVDFKFKVKSSAMKILSCNEELADIKYLYYLMQITHIQSDTHKRYWISDYSKIPVSLPPLSTQRLIVSRIESLFAELDKGVEHLRNAQQQLKTYRQAVLNYWLNNDDGKWEMVKLGDVADAIDPEPSHRTPKIQKDGIPFVSIKDCDYKTNTINLQTARLVSKDVLAEHKERYSINEGDFIIGKIGTIGNPVNVILPQEYALSANVVLIQPTNKIDAKFLYNTFRSNIVEKQLFDGKKATTQAAFGIKKVRLIEIPLPPLSDQHRIVKEIESRLSQTETVEASIEKALQQSEALRQSILKKAFNGELV